MASFCILCSKKLGLFSSYGEDIFTGDPSNKICNECLKKAETILKKVEMKIPVEAEDYDRFTEEGLAFVNEYLEPDGIKLGGGAVSTETTSPKELEVGDATIGRTFEIDPDETENILAKLSEMSSDEIEAFLEGLVSENDTAENFMNDIKALDDEELQSVVSDQREYFNNAEWAYIMYVYNFRNGISADVEEKETEILPPDGAFDQAEISRMTEQFSDKTSEELAEIVSDESYTPEARMAAKNLLNG